MADVVLALGLENLLVNEKFATETDLNLTFYNIDYQTFVTEYISDIISAYGPSSRIMGVGAFGISKAF